MRHPFCDVALAFGLMMLGVATVATAEGAPPFVWIEAEKPSAGNMKFTVEPTAHPEWVSDGKWLRVSVEAKDQQQVPDEGLNLKYEFTAGEAGDTQIWARIGFESNRAEFDWRVDEGEWRHIDSKDLCVDLMSLSFFCEVQWLKLGDQKLSAGKHQLELRVSKSLDSKGKPKNFLFAADCFCVSAGPFKPNSKFKPDEDPRTDADRDAAKHVFQLGKTTEKGARSSLRLKGSWEICRDDEGVPDPVDQPIKKLPDSPVWSAIKVPGDKAAVRPDLTFAHKVWYRARVAVPADFAGRSFFIELPEVNLNATVFVNDLYCGFAPHPFARAQIDVTKAIKPGETNEIYVGIRDAWYAYYQDPKNVAATRHNFALPVSFLTRSFQDLVYPVWNHAFSGLIETPVFIAAGPAYASDVFVKTSVAKGEIVADVTVLNPTSEEANGEVLCSAIDPRTGQVVKQLPATPFSAPAGAEKVVTLSAAWSDAKLWWPDPDAAMYVLRTEVRVKQQSVDVSDTSFGFREWTWEGRDFKLNGVIWHGWAEVTNPSDPDKWLGFYRKTNQRFFRFWAPSKFCGMEDADALDWFDRNGVVIRRTGVFDGEAIGYERRYLPLLCKNAMAQELAKIRGERNHPSIMIWSLENEVAFVNAFNMNWIDEWEKWTAEMWKVVHNEIDPTRPVMVDGGGAGKANLLPVAGDHYIVGDPSLYPRAAYETNAAGGGRGRWTWDEKRPRFIGEDFFFAGNHPELSALGGDVAFGGKAATLPACGLMWQILQQGYRWADHGAWHFWLGRGDADDSQYLYYASRAVLFRDWDWTFASGTTAHRKAGLFNDAHSNDAITFSWALLIDGKKVAGETAEYKVPAGTREYVDLAIPVPAVSGRAEAELVISLTVGEQEVFHDRKAVSILQPSVEMEGLTAAAGSIVVLDPAGRIAPFLTKHGIASQPINDLKSLPASCKLLIVGKDVVSPTASTSSDLAELAAAGRAIVVLEQMNTLKYQALPAELDPSDIGGQVAFPEDLGHPVMKGLKAKDFFTWGANGDLFRNAYIKPTRGARSLLQCGPSLKNSALVEIQTGKGIILLSQLLVEEKLPESAVSQQLLLNLVKYGASYKQVIREVSAVVTDAPELGKVIDSIGLRYESGDDPIAAISRPGTVAIISATPTSLAKLADNPAKVQAFTESGGWILLNGLTPEGLAAYNKIVRVDHLIRPFIRERVTFAPVRDPLLAGTTTSDLAMYSSKRIFPFQDGDYVVSDEFKYVVDHDEVAPFAKSPFAHFDNIVNGFVSADGWPLIINFPVNPDGSPFDVEMTFPRRETFTELTWIGNTNYLPQTKLNLVFDGDESTKLSYDVQPNRLPQVLKIDPPREATRVTLQIADWEKNPSRQQLIGIDNIYLKVQRSQDFLDRVKPMLNVGGIVKYPRGSGGIVLCNLQFKASEEVPLNAVKKTNLLTTILRNLNAHFTGSNTVISRSAWNYAQLDIAAWANQYRDEKGWFDKKLTFADIPVGKQKFSGVDYNVYDFATSPVPTVVMLGNSKQQPGEVKGIVINRKADALYFLQTARVDKPLSQNEVANGKKIELFRYVVHYEDGTSVNIPVRLGVEIGNFAQKEPLALSGAQVAWTAPYAGTGLSAVAYSMQWDNPKKDIAIKTVDMVYTEANRGVPALIALTAGTARE